MSHDKRTFDCANCTEQQKQYWRCRENDSTVRYSQIGKEAIMGCPMKYIDADTVMTLDIYRMHKSGTPAYNDGALNMPAYLYEAFGIIDAEVSRIQQVRQ